MKRISMSLVAVIVAFATHAASVNWGVNSKAWKSQDETYAAMGTSVWLIDNAYQATIVAALKNSSVINFTGDWESAVSGLTGVLGSSMTANAQGWISPLEISSDQMEHEGTYDLATLLIDDTSSSKYVYYQISGLFEEATAYDTSISPEAELEEVVFTSDEFSSANWKVAQTMDTPEPTSGLLMLIGMAGLALRRRRA